MISNVKQMLVHVISVPLSEFWNEAHICESLSCNAHDEHEKTTQFLV